MYQLILTILTLAVVHGQNSVVPTTPESAQSTEAPKSEGLTCITDNGERGECVWYYLCNIDTNTVITDGDDLINIRSSSPCPLITQVCCHLPNKRPPSDPITPPPPQKNQNIEQAALQAIVEFIYSPSSLVVTADKAEALLSAATMLGVGGLRDAVCVFMERALTADNALGIHAFAELHACTALAAAAARFINANFQQVLQADELLKLTPDALATLLDCLTVPHEQRFYAVLRWTQHCPQERQQHLFKLLSHVRLSLVPLEVLAERARVEPLASAEQRVQRQLVDALTSLYLSSSCRTRPHGAADSGPHALLVVGGYKTGSTSSVWSYELSSGRWQSLAALPAARYTAGAAVLDGRVYVVGGYDDDTRCQSSTFVFDVSRGSWSSGPSLITARSHLSVAALDGVLYAVGGQDSTGTALSSAESLDPREGVWRAIGRMSTARSAVRVAALDGRLYAVGGYSGKETLNTVERYDPSSGRWEPVESMSERRWGAAVSVVEDVLYVAGGWNGSSRVRSVERYRAGSRWEPAPDMITARSYAAATMHAGRLYVAGGQDDRNVIHSSVEVFSPSTGAWSELPAAMPEARVWAAAVVVHWPPSAP